MIDQFTTWLQSRQPEIENIGILLATQLSSEPAELINDLVAVEVWNGRLYELLAACNAFLDRAKLFYLPEGGEMRETERKAVVEDRVADIKKTRDILDGYCDAVKQRLILGESILRWEKPHADPNAGMERRSAAEILRNR